MRTILKLIVVTTLFVIVGSIALATNLRNYVRYYYEHNADWSSTTDFTYDNSEAWACFKPLLSEWGPYDYFYRLGVKSAGREDLGDGWFREHLITDVTDYIKDLDCAPAGEPEIGSPAPQPEIIQNAPAFVTPEGCGSGEIGHIHQLKAGQASDTTLIRVEGTSIDANGNVVATISEVFYFAKQSDYWTLHHFDVDTGAITCGKDGTMKAINGIPESAEVRGVIYNKDVHFTELRDYVEQWVGTRL